MSKVAVRIEKVKDTKGMGSRERHNRRKGNVKSSDKAREHLNKYNGPESIAKHINALEERINANLKVQGKRVTRKDAVKLIEVVMSSDGVFFEKTDPDQYFNACDEFLSKFWGKDNVIGEYLHMDEDTPHKHYFITPIKDNKFNFSAFIDGRNDLSAFQQKAQDFLIEKGFDLEERELASVTGKKHQRVRDWAKNVTKAEGMVALMDEQKKTDYAVKCVMAENDHEALYNRLEDQKERIEALEGDSSFFMNEASKYKEKYNALRTGVLSATKNNQKTVNEMEKWGAHRNKILLEQQEEKILSKEKNNDMEL